MNEVRFTIELPPRTKKNHSVLVKNKTTGKYMPIPSKQYREYEAKAGEYITDPIKIGILSLSLPLNIKSVFYMDTLRKVDLVNLEQALLDILVKHKVLLDDNYTVVASMDGSRVDYDKDYPRTEIEISEIPPFAKKGRRT